MNDPHERVNNLEEFLADDEGMEKTEIVRELRLQGVDTTQFFARVKKAVQDGYSAQLRASAEQQQKQQVTRPAFLSQLGGMPREALLAIFKQFQSGAYGVDYREAALARCRHKDESTFTDDELRSWLEDIGDIWGEPRHDS